MKSFFNRRNLFSSAVSIVLSVAFVASVAFATTISTSIQTDGTLSVTGASTLTGNVSAGGTLAVTGIGTFNGQLQASSTALFGQGVTAYGTVLVPALTIGASAASNSLDGTLLLASRASDPIGVTQGTFYYNSTSKVLKMYDGTSWFTVGTSTSGITLVGARLQLGDLTTQYLTLGTSSPFVVLTPTHSALVTIQATTSTSIPLVIGGALNQAANLLSIRNDANSKLFYVTSAGNLFATGTLQVTGALTTYGPTTLGDAVGDTITLNGNATAAGTFGVTGLTTLGFASTTAVSLNGATANLMVNGMATTTASTGAFGAMGNISAGTTTSPTSAELSADGTATTTIGAFSSSALAGGCIQLKANNGKSYRMYINGATNTEEATTTPGGKVGFIAIWEAGSCK